MLKLNFATEQTSVHGFLRERAQKSWLIISFLMALMLITVGMEALMPRVLGWLLDDFQNGVVRQGLIWKAVLALVVFTIATLSYRYFFSVIAANDLFNLRKVLWTQFKSSSQTFDRKFHKLFFSALMQDAAACSSIFSTILIQSVQIFFHAVVVFILMAQIHLTIATLFWSFIALAVAVSLKSNGRYERLVEVHRQKNAAYLQSSHQLAKDGRHIMYAGFTNMGKRKILNKMFSYMKWREKSARKMVGIELTIKFILFISISIAVSGLIYLQSKNLFSTGEALSFVFLALLATAPVNQSTMLWGSIKRLKVSLARLKRIESQLNKSNNSPKIKGASIAQPFRDSLRENLALGKGLTDQELTEALDIFELREEFYGLNITLDSDLSSWTQKLSLGQKQRLQLARLYLHSDSEINENDMSAIEPESRSIIVKRLKGGHLAANN